MLNRKKKKKNQVRNDITMGQTLRLIRIIKDISLTEMAKALEISIPYLSEIENGKKPATWYICSSYSNIGGINLGDIIGFATALAMDSQKTMRSWQSKAIEAMEQISYMGTEHGK